MAMAMATVTPLRLHQISIAYTGFSPEYRTHVGAQLPVRRTISPRGFLKTVSLNEKFELVADDEANNVFSQRLQEFPTTKHIKDLRKTHAYLIKSGLEPDLSFSNRLLNRYLKCGSLEDARQVFDKMPERDTGSWGHIIAGYAQNKCGAEALELFGLLQRNGAKLNELILTSVVHACTALDDIEQGRQAHGYIIKAGLDTGVGIGIALVTMYAKRGSVDDARQVFDGICKPNHVSWTAMIGGYARYGVSEEALKLFSAMNRSELKPNQFTFSIVLSVLTDLGDLEEGKGIHAYVIKKGFDVDDGVGSGLLAMYVKCGSMDDACQLFDEMPRRNVISWTTLIGGFARNRCSSEALELLSGMVQAGVRPNEFTFCSVLSACSTRGALAEGKEIHAQILRNGLQSDLNLGCGLISMYSSCGHVDYAQSVFGRMAEWNVVLWTAMIVGYAQNGQYEEALKHFIMMKQQGLRPNEFTFSSVLSACASLGILGQGKHLHAYVVKTRFRSHVSVGNALVTMYAKCGSIEDAYNAFRELPDHDLISWNAMIAAFAQHGNGGKALQIFEQMQQRGIKPDHITFVGVLSACSNVGLVEKGRYFFDVMIEEHGITPCLEHYTCMVDLLGCAGLLDEAEEVLRKMPFKADVGVWRALLSACRTHSNMRLAEHAAECILRLETKLASTYVLLSNIYAATERWDSVEKVRKMMEDRGVTKEPGQSWIEVQKTVHTFISRDRSHPQTEEIYAKLWKLTSKMKEVGSVPTSKWLWNDVEEEQNDQFCYHSERLAISFGLISTSSEMPVRVVKNLSVCSDCHAFTKFVSKVVGREIVVRDTSRFHHFKDGLCSCGNYW